jgi:hypothetical protein
VQQAIRLLEVLGALGDAQLELAAPLTQLAHRLLELAEKCRDHEPGEHHGGHEEQQKQQRLGERPGRERAEVALERVPERDRADGGGRGGDLALAEAERRPDDERHDEKGGGVGRAPLRAAAEDGVRCGEKQHREGHALGDARAAPAHQARPGPGEDERRGEDDAGGVALPPGEPVAEELRRGQRMHEPERQQGEGRRDGGRERREPDELHHVFRAAEAVRNADMASDQLSAHDGLHAAAGSDER